jgi:hypothetical protein
MSDFQEVDIGALLQQRLASKTSQAVPKNGFDPYQTMLRRKQGGNGDVISNIPIQKWPEADVNKLENFCKSMGIVGFSAGNMSPLAALSLLRQKLGIPNDFPSNESVSVPVSKKMLLMG